ncbi:hypothetical protein IWZ01DRAFT_536909 [Phyllosticta capitalensis]
MDYHSVSEMSSVSGPANFGFSRRASSLPNLFGSIGSQSPTFIAQNMPSANQNPSSLIFKLCCNSGEPFAVSTNHHIRMAEQYCSSSPFASLDPINNPSTTIIASGNPTANRYAQIPTIQLAHGPPSGAIPSEILSPRLENYISCGKKGLVRITIPGGLAGLFTQFINHQPSYQGNHSHKLASLDVNTRRSVLSSAIPMDRGQRLDCILDWIKRVHHQAGVEPPLLPPLDMFEWDTPPAFAGRIPLPGTQTDVEMLSTATAAVTLDKNNVVDATPDVSARPQSATLSEWEEARAQAKASERASRYERREMRKAVSEEQKASISNKVSNGRVGKKQKRNKRHRKNRLTNAERLAGLAGHHGEAGASTNDVDMDGAASEEQKASISNKVSNGRVGKKQKRNKRHRKNRLTNAERLAGLAGHDADVVASTNDVDMDGGASNDEGPGKAGHRLLHADDDMLCNRMQDLEMAE